MKQSYKKLYIYQFAILLVLLLNSFVSNILSKFGLPIFLLIALVLFKFLFGFERGRNRYTKDIIYEVIIFLGIFLMSFYLFGIKIGFVEVGNYYNVYGIFNYILPITLSIILKEVLRYMMLKKVEGSKGLNITTYILFIIIDITTVIFYTDFANGKEVFEFISLSLLPAISSNFAYNYISKKVGIVPITIYSLVMGLYVYLIPIIPDANEFLSAILTIVLPILLMNRVYNLFEREKRDKLKQDYKDKNYILLLIPTVFTIIIIYFTSGYFHFSTLTIASGSMEPKINKGDVVIIEKINNKDKLEVGDVIVYNYNGTIIVHRLVDILKIGDENFYYTKGDNNESKDSYVVTRDMIIGTTKVKIPFIGMPTLWLNGL